MPQRETDPQFGQMLETGGRGQLSDATGFGVEERKGGETAVVMLPTPGATLRVC